MQIRIAGFFLAYPSEKLIQRESFVFFEQWRTLSRIVTKLQNYGMNCRNAK
jgi:hypothetical protein